MDCLAGIRESAVILLAADARSPFRRFGIAVERIHVTRCPRCAVAVEDIPGPFPAADVLDITHCGIELITTIHGCDLHFRPSNQSATTHEDSHPR
jgi:hypothetical protein